MPNSYNGFPVITDQALLETLPGISGKVRKGDIWTIFNWLVSQYSSRVEEINRKDSWGYSYRKVRGGSSSWSNHASGTAVDFNATKHPFKVARTMSSRQRAACHAIMADSGQVLKWLEDFDEMHWEIRKGTTSTQLKAFANKIKQQEKKTMSEITDAFKERVLKNPEDPNGRRWSVEDYLYSIRKQANVAAKRAAKVETKLATLTPSPTFTVLDSTYSTPQDESVNGGEIK